MKNVTKLLVSVAILSACIMTNSPVFAENTNRSFPINYLTKGQHLLPDQSRLTLRRCRLQPNFWFLASHLVIPQ
jgi:hypothetical protein